MSIWKSYSLVLILWIIDRSKPLKVSRKCDKNLNKCYFIKKLLVFVIILTNFFFFHLNPNWFYNKKLRHTLLLDSSLFTYIHTNIQIKSSYIKYSLYYSLFFILFNLFFSLSFIFFSLILFNSLLSCYLIISIESSFPHNARLIAIPN